ncbi:MAG: FHA domain-containing protein [Pseudobdellovibrio sp.]
MSRLKVVLRGTLISEIELTPEKEYIGGRKEGCDIRLQPEKGISREHFKLKFNDGKWQIIAISRFGDVFSLGQKIEQVDLQHGQSFHVPPYDFTFLDLPDAGVPDGRERIPIEVNENTRTILGAAPQMPYVKISNSKGEILEMLRLEVGDVWVAGRDPSCQIIIPDQRVSRRQFEIHKVNGAYTILDLASVNGTFLNGSPVSSTDPQTLKSGDAISVLDNIMYFELHDPNFKYKVENIEIPPLQVESEPEPIAPLQPAPEENVEEVEESVVEDSRIEESPESSQVMQQIEQYDVPPQISAGDSPFTGMPNDQQFDPNQFYNFNPQQPPQPAAPPPPTGLKAITQNKPLLITIVIIFLAGAYWLSENMGQPEEPQQPKQVENSSDPFSKLTPEQQKQVTEFYSLAEQMYSQQKYDLALEDIKKLKEILPSGYKDSDKIEHEAEQAYETIIQQQNDEKAQKEKEEQDAKIKQVIAECEKKLSPTITAEEMNQCLAPVVAINPDNPDYVRLMAAAEKIQNDKKQKEAEAKNYEQQVAEFKTLFEEAEKVQQQGLAFKAIKKYKVVLESPLPDPKNLKKIAQDRIGYIEDKIKEKSETSIAAADSLYKASKIREAVLTLREAIVYDPDNASIKEKIESYSNELTKISRALYQEAIIEENYGIIDSTETKQGAKDKWKKITDIDLEDGEYYRKAIVKLRRYGVY